MMKTREIEIVGGGFGLYIEGEGQALYELVGIFPTSAKAASAAAACRKAQASHQDAFASLGGNWGAGRVCARGIVLAHGGRFLA